VSLLLWILTGLGVLVVVVRQRSFAIGLITIQALALVGLALQRAGGGADLLAAAALAARAVALAALFLLLAARTREPRPVRGGVDPFLRALLAVSLAFALAWLVPSLGLSSRQAERAVLALVAFGLVSVATRRATLQQIIGIVLVENGLALAALEQAHPLAVAIELGVAVDLTVIAFVAAGLHWRIFEQFGTGDSAVLRSLRD
jgi:hydrogenase-4 membrane subunit HyfE